MTAIQTQNGSTLAAAQSRFTQAVSQGIVQLMRQCGYSRERATAALLRELGRGDVPPNNNEVFDTMTCHGLGVDDASQALLVSRAVRRAMKERGLSAVEAIDDLSLKLNISNLVSSSPSEEPAADEHAIVGTSSRPSSPQQRAAPTPTPATADRVATQQQQQRKRKASAKTNHKIVKQKKSQSRKRPAPPPTSNDEKKFSSSRERADSVTEAVEAKAKKARRSSPEDSPSPAEAGSDNNPSNTIIVRSKRNVATNLCQEQSQSNNTI